MKQNETRKYWKEKWESFWVRYYSLSTRVYRDRRLARRKNGGNELSPRDYCMRNFLEQNLPERFFYNKADWPQNALGTTKQGQDDTN